MKVIGLAAASKSFLLKELPLRAVIPGKVSLQYIEELGHLQTLFLRSITASDEKAEQARKAWPDWVKNEKETNRPND